MGPHKNNLRFEIKYYWSFSHKLLPVTLKGFSSLSSNANKSEMRNRYKILVGKAEYMKPLVMPIHRYKVNIDVDLKKAKCKLVNGFKWLKIVLGGGLFCIYMAVNLQVTQKFG
jgi:hypothetical protein